MRRLLATLLSVRWSTRFLSHVFTLEATTDSLGSRSSDAGHLVLRKATVASRVHTSVSLTSAGRAADAGHVPELQRLIAGTRAAVPQQQP